MLISNNTRFSLIWSNIFLRAACPLLVGIQSSLCVWFLEVQVTQGDGAVIAVVFRGIQIYVFVYFLYSWFRASWLYNNKIQRDATYAGVYLLQNYSTCFGCLLHPSSGVHQTVTPASGTGHSVRATTFHQRGLIRPRWQKVVASRRLLR